MSRNRRLGFFGRPLEGDALDQKGFEDREIEAVWRKGTKAREVMADDARRYHDIRIDIIAMDHFFGRRGIEEDRRGNCELAELCREVVYWTRCVRDRQPLPNEPEEVEGE